MNAVDLIINQHREIEQLFTRFEKAKRQEEKEKIFNQLAATLVAHDTIEREHFYPAAERALGKSEELAKALVQHGLMEFSIFTTEKAKKKPSFETMVKVLKELKMEHVEMEERDILPKAKSKMGSEQLDKLGAAMAERFEQAMSRDYRTPVRALIDQTLAGRVTVPPKRVARTAVGRKRAAATKTRAVKRPKARRGRARAKQ